MSLGVLVLCVFFNTGVFYRPPGDFLTIAICFYHFCFIIYKPGAMLKKDFFFQNPAPVIGRRLSAYSLLFSCAVSRADTYQHVILTFFAHYFMLCKAKINFGEVLRPFLKSNFYLEIRHLVSTLVPYKVHKPPKNCIY